MAKSQQTIPLGFEIGTGKPVSIPVRHMVITGQTQEAGKTTTLEALISRAGLPACAFVTKRGEGSFGDGRRVQPYLRERADWQFVASVLEATMREKLKFERAWIMRASKGATTLADVQRNVQSLMATAKGLSADVYMTLDAYLEIVVPRLQQIEFADQLHLAAGLNVLDLSERDSFPPELQALVMRSVLEWVYEREHGVITIIPEAWEFIPQGRGSPVKLSAVELIRKGAGLRNYVWLDSQDIGGVDKELLRSCPVWLLGVQREVNEIKRVLGNIPDGVAKPKPTDVATLERGQFFACFGRTVSRVYVQPAWMDDAAARAIAIGDRSIDDVSRPAPHPSPLSPHPSPPKRKASPVVAPVPVAVPPIDINALAAALVRQLRPDDLAAALPPALAVAPPASADEEAMYQRFKARLLAEAPGLIKLLAQRPELVVELERVTVEVDGKSLKGRAGRLIAAGFFKSAKRHADVMRELKRTGPDVNSGNLATALKDYVKKGFLTDEEDGYRAVEGMKAQIVEK